MVQTQSRGYSGVEKTSYIGWVKIHTIQETPCSHRGLKKNKIFHFLGKSAECLADPDRDTDMRKTTSKEKSVTSDTIDQGC